MERHAAALKGMLAFALALHIHHRFHGPPVDYFGLALAAAASWAGIPGPGEPVLIAAAIFAARQNLDITSVILVAWLGASAGGLAGWLVGFKAGRAVVTARGPLRGLRIRAVERGEQVFARQPVLAVLLTPSWVAGIHRVGIPVYVLANELGATLWAAGIGLAAYWVGPPVVDAVGDLGLLTGAVLVALVVAVLGEELVRRRRGRRRHSAQADQH
jgi:membrane protein DedA with SNARE-associated domain